MIQWVRAGPISGSPALRMPPLRQLVVIVMFSA